MESFQFILPGAQLYGSNRFVLYMNLISGRGTSRKLQDQWLYRRAFKSVGGLS